jgi:hypothetical protein
MVRSDDALGAAVMLPGTLIAAITTSALDMAEQTPLRA